MGLLDKVESNETESTKKAPAKAVKAAKVAKAAPVAAKAAPAKPKKEKKEKVKKARPAGLSSEFEIAPKLSRVISWWVNFLANFQFSLRHCSCQHSPVVKAVAWRPQSCLLSPLWFGSSMLFSFHSIQEGTSDNIPLPRDSFAVMVPNRFSSMDCS